jgi:hypothetical protein
VDKTIPPVGDRTDERSDFSRLADQAGERPADVADEKLPCHVGRPKDMAWFHGLFREPYSRPDAAMEDLFEQAPLNGDQTD